MPFFSNYGLFFISYCFRIISIMVLYNALYFVTQQWSSFYHRVYSLFCHPLKNVLGTLFATFFVSLTSTDDLCLMLVNKGYPLLDVPHFTGHIVNNILTQSGKSEDLSKSLTLRRLPIQIKSNSLSSRISLFLSLRNYLTLLEGEIDPKAVKGIKVYTLF